MWVWAAAAGIAGIVIGCLLALFLLRRTAARCLDKLDCLNKYIAPSRRLQLDNEEDSGHYEQIPSPLEESISEAMERHARGPMIRTRVMVEVPVSDPTVRRELMALRERGDGQWLAIGIERVMKDARLNKDMLELKRRTVPANWTLSGIEPAYESANGLFVWFEIERPISELREHRKAA